MKIFSSSRFSLSSATSVRFRRATAIPKALSAERSGNEGGDRRPLTRPATSVPWTKPPRYARQPPIYDGGSEGTSTSDHLQATNPPDLPLSRLPTTEKRCPALESSAFRLVQ
ncbi:potassium channel subfamily K member 2 [Striga asiatica]|uniref:Potassium channel subfamily K member 2 n=1 Tax=Striga asiatica TaxID=4170 RepID=A0A5A7RIS8_STRAF|nr:potassium channel subfamily K member 2 [Striga asiatica]